MSIPAARIAIARIAMTIAVLLAAEQACNAQDRPVGEQVFPQGSLFPCSAYSMGANGHRADIARARSVGFNLIGPQYESNATILEDARANRMKAIYTVGADVDFLKEKPLPKPVDQLAADVAKQVSDVASNPDIAWWNLAQEEMRTWRQGEMAYLEAAVNAIRAADPLKRPILMYDAGHRSSAEMAITSRYLDFSAKGSYVNYTGQVDRRAWLAASVRQEVEAAQAVGRKVTPLLVPEMFRNAPDGRHDEIPRWVRHDVVRGVIEGAAGLLIFSFRHRENFQDYEAYWSAYATITPYLCGEGELGQALLGGETVRGLTVVLPADVKNEEIEAFGKTVSVPPVGVKAMRHADSLFLLIANSTKSQVSGSIEGLPEVASWTSLVPPLASGTLANGAFSLGPWEALVLKTPLHR